MKVREGRALITGEVHTAERRQHVGDAVAELAPDLEIVNDLGVTEERTLGDGPGRPEVIA